MSLVCRSDGEKYPLVKHYQIKVQKEGENVMYFLAEKYLFSSIPELIRYHQHNPAGELRKNFSCSFIA